MNIFIQGMRRSGTTFLYDILSADGRFDAYYEPLAKAHKKAKGGGSGVSNEDFFQRIRDARTNFSTEAGLINTEILNWGAPRDPGLELQESFAPEVRQYILHLISQSEFSLLKFVRCFNKISQLAIIDKNAILLHIVRNPKAVATSFLFGKGQKWKKQFYNADTFFNYRENSQIDTIKGPKKLQALEIANLLINTGKIKGQIDNPVYEKLMALWKYHFIHTHKMGELKFGKRYCLIRYEDLITSPEETLELIYNQLGEKPPLHVNQWLLQNVTKRPQAFLDKNPRWIDSIKNLELQHTLQLAGYSKGAI